MLTDEDDYSRGARLHGKADCGCVVSAVWGRLPGVVGAAAGLSAVRRPAGHFDVRAPMLQLVGVDVEEGRATMRPGDDGSPA